MQIKIETSYWTQSSYCWGPPRMCPCPHTLLPCQRHSPKMQYPSLLVPAAWALLPSQTVLVFTVQPSEPGEHALPQPKMLLKSLHLPHLPGRHCSPRCWKHPMLPSLALNLAVILMSWFLCVPRVGRPMGLRNDAEDDPRDDGTKTSIQIFTTC